MDFKATGYDENKSRVDDLRIDSQSYMKKIYDTMKSLSQS